MDMIPFLTLVLLVVYIFATINFISPYAEDDGTPKSFIVHLGDQYRILYGENPDPGSTQQWMVYFTFSLFMNVLMFNLLISIIGDTFERVLTS